MILEIHDVYHSMFMFQGLYIQARSVALCFEHHVHTYDRACLGFRYTDQQGLKLESSIGPHSCFSARVS